jgi:hypothetical protein
MKYHGAREGYDPKKYDRVRSSGALTLWPFKFSIPLIPDPLFSKKRRAKNVAKNANLNRNRRKHGRSS